ncbi:MAG: sulfatase [Planctomycetota bacterium]
MNRRDFLKKSIYGTAVFISGCSKTSLFESANNKLNFLFILIDDLGWMDLGCYGSSFYETPNIDKLANQGMRFTQAYAASPICSPTRASILSGKNPARLKLTQWIGGPQEPTPYKLQMPLEETTIAETFKEAGYATGFIGKWHLGREEFYPTKQGFDTNIAGCQIGTPKTYFSPYDIPTMKEGPEGEYLTDRLTDDAVKFIEKNKDTAFLLYLSHYAVHTPIQAKKEITAKYEVKAKKLPRSEKKYYDIGDDYKTYLVQSHAVYAAMVESVDQSIGKIIKKLKALGLNKNTVVIFMSDNGGVATYHKSYGKAPTANVPLREGKGWLYEGGIREPMIIKWPGVTKPGSVCDEPVISTDFYPTMLEMAGLPAKPNQHTDGISLVPLLKGTRSLDRKALYWHYPHFNAFGNIPGGAIRVGDYKLIEYYEDNRIELYDLKNDIGEKQNLFKKEPQRAGELRKMLHNQLKEVDANMPTQEGLERAWEKIEKGTFLPWMRRRTRKK